MTNRAGTPLPPDGVLDPSLRRRGPDGPPKPCPVDLGIAAPGIAELALHWLEADALPRLIVDTALTIQWLNLGAERELRRRRDIRRRGDLLVAADPSRQAELLALLARCREGGSDLSLPTVDLDGHIRFVAAPLPGNRFGLTFRRYDAGFKPTYPGLAAAFRLTRSEINVLLLLADGHSAGEAARLLSVSTGTTRSHIKNLYAKLNVKSREGLLSRIRAYQG